MGALADSAATRMRRSIHTWSELTKSRLVMLVVVTAGVGYVLASGDAFSWSRLAWTALGTALAAAGSMALNEWMEASRDALMERTCRRPLPAGVVTQSAAAVAGVVLVVAGLVLLWVMTTPLTAALGLAVVLTYTLVYTPLKPRTSLCTLAGAVCGALPPMMGWAAAGNGLGFGAWLLGGVLFLWQIPHFLALAWLYRDDYRRGGFRMLPVVEPDGRSTARMVTIYSAALLVVAVSATPTGLAGPAYATGAALLSAGLLAAGVHLGRTRSDASARRLFLSTLVYLPLLLGLLVADRRPADYPAVQTAWASPTPSSAPFSLQPTSGGIAHR